MDIGAPRTQDLHISQQKFSHDDCKYPNLMLSMFSETERFVPKLKNSYSWALVFSLPTPILRMSFWPQPTPCECMCPSYRSRAVRPCFVIVCGSHVPPQIRVRCQKILCGWIWLPKSSKLRSCFSLKNITFFAKLILFKILWCANLNAVKIFDWCPSDIYRVSEKHDYVWE